MTPKDLQTPQGATARLRAVASACFVSARTRAGAVAATMARPARAFASRRKAQDFLGERNLRFVEPVHPLIDVVAVGVLSDRLLRLEFSNGEGRILSLSRWLMETEVVGEHDRAFAGARVHGGSVRWPGGLELAPEILFELTVPAP